MKQIKCFLVCVSVYNNHGHLLGLKISQAVRQELWIWWGGYDIHNTQRGINTCV